MTSRSTKQKTKPCPDCGVMIRPASTRCQPCARKPEYLAIAAERYRETMRRKMEEDPEFARQWKLRCAQNSRNRMLKPEVRAKLVELGKEAYRQRLQTPEALAKWRASRDRAARLWSETRTGWRCPDGYWEEYLSISKKNRKKAREIIDKKAAEEAAVRQITAAIDYLKRWVSVSRCDEHGRIDPKGKFYRYGTAVLTAVEVVARARTRGFANDDLRLTG